MADSKAVDYLAPKVVCEKSCGGRTRLEYLVAQSDEVVKGLIGQTRKVCGWSKTVRKQGGGSLLFVMLNDGSCSSNLQVIINEGVEGYAELTKTNVFTSFEMVGEIVESPADGQLIELHIKPDGEGHYAKILGACTTTKEGKKYPLAKGKINKETLRGPEMAHLRCRTYFFSAVCRIRNEMAMATHTFFNQRGFKYIHTPLITATDCEGAGEMFQVTTLLGNKEMGKDDKIKAIPTIKDKGYDIDYKQDFFGKKSYLTVSGQLALENFAHGLADVYTFGPTFRAENSHTKRHLAEFWMIEPEMCFAKLDDVMESAESYVKFCLEWLFEKCADDLEYLNKNDSPGLIDILTLTKGRPFTKLSYTEAIKLLKEHVEAGKITFERQPSWGFDMGSEHERYICEKVYEGPVIVYNYPAAIKSFYMKLNDESSNCPGAEGDTVQAMDVLVPGVGELIGGSVREEGLEKLDALMKNHNLNPKDYEWYRQLRQWGGVPHGGYGLGFDRLICMVTGMENIRDVIPFPRYPGTADF